MKESRSECVKYQIGNFLSLCLSTVTRWENIQVSGSSFYFVKAAKYFSFELSEDTLLSHYKYQIFGDVQKVVHISTIERQSVNAVKWDIKREMNKKECSVLIGWFHAMYSNVVSGLKEQNSEFTWSSGKTAGRFLNPGNGCQIYSRTDKPQADYPIIWPQKQDRHFRS